MNNQDVDIVITWVNGADKEWLREKTKYLGGELSNKEIDSSANRYRSWDNLQFLFRGIEKYMPWVRKVHFITNGQKPEWLNLNCSKLSWVQHKDYIPAEYLPTFNSHPIELNMHRIEGLAEKFVYLNDDCFVIGPTRETDFFVDDLPCDQVSLWRVLSMEYSDPMPHIMINNSAVINNHFDLRDVIKRNPWVWLSPKNSLTNLLLTAGLLPISRNKIPALYYHHLPQPFLKSTFQKVWDEEGDILDAVSCNRFRSQQDVSPGLFKYWQIMSGEVHPKNVRKSGRYSNMEGSDIVSVEKIIRTQSKQLLCLNDAKVEDFEHTKQVINSAFMSILPDKSEFEL